MATTTSKESWLNGWMAKSKSIQSMSFSVSFDRSLNIQIMINILVRLVVIFLPFSTVLGQNNYFLRFRHRRCQPVFPTRQQLFQSNVVVLIGFVEQIKPLDQENELNEQNSQSSNYLANVLVRRVLHGPRSLQRTRIQVTGFNPPQSVRDKDPSWCHPNTRQDESWIFVLQPINPPDYFRLNSSLIRVTLSNIEKFDAIIADKPYGLKPNFPELPCEKKYCENNANCINEPYGEARCECLTTCKTSKYEPVCGSDDETYNNECEMRMRSCRAGKNVFVKSTSSCQYSGRPGQSGYTPMTSSSSSSSSLSSSSSMTSSLTSPGGYGSSGFNRQNYRLQSSSSSPGSYSVMVPPPSAMERHHHQRPQYPLPDENRWQTRHHTISTTNILNRSY